jgi:hypothetical protein
MNQDNFDLAPLSVRCSIIEVSKHHHEKTRVTYIEFLGSRTIETPPQNGQLPNLVSSHYFFLQGSGVPLPDFFVTGCNSSITRNLCHHLPRGRCYDHNFQPFLTTFDKITLDKTTLDKTTLDKTTLDKMTLDKTMLDKTTLDETTLDKMKLDETMLDKTTLDKTMLDEMTLDKTTLDKTTLDKTMLDKMTLDNRHCTKF